MAGERVGPSALRVPLNSCSTLESRPCTSPGQCSSAGPADRSAGESALRSWECENWPCPRHLLCGSEGEGKMSFPHPGHQRQMRELTLPFTSCSTWESGPCISPGQHSKTDSVYSCASWPGEAPCLICHRWSGQRKKALTLCCLWQVGELAVPLTAHSAWQSGPCTSPGKYSVELAVVVQVWISKPAPRTWEQENQPCPLLLTALVS